MRTKIKGIVLNIVKHSDRHNVVNLYTPTHGRITCVAPAGGQRSKLPRLMLLSTIETEINFSSTRELQQLRTYALSDVHPSLYTDPMKMTIAIFLADFLNHLLKEAQPDAGIWKFIQGSLSLLDISRLSPNFHLVFISAIAPFVGIQPDLEGCNSNKWFDMRAGRYTAVAPPHNDFLPPGMSHWPSLLSRLTYYNADCLRLSGEQRYQILESILHYYALHIPGIASMKSHHVMREIFT